MMAGTEVIFVYIFFREACYLPSNKDQEKMLEAYIYHVGYCFTQISSHFRLVEKMNGTIL